MVAGHGEAPFSHFVYLFHMAVFYIISGYLYSEKNSLTFRRFCGFVRRKVKGLWFPFFVCSAVFAALNNVFLRLSIYTDNNMIFNYVGIDHAVIHRYLIFRKIAIAICKCAFFNNNSELGGAFWFLRDLFVISIAYCLCSFVIRKLCSMIRIRDEEHQTLMLNSAQCVLSFILLTVGYYFSEKDITVGGIGKIASCYCLFYIGHLFGLKNPKEFFHRLNQKQWILVVIITSFALLALSRLGSISLANNRYVNPAFLLTASVSGWLWLYGLSFFICKLKSIKGLTAIYKFIIYTGQHTLMIVLLHFLAFKIGNCIACSYFNYPSCCIAAFPTLCGDVGAWWILFTFIGVVVPLIVSRIFTGIRNNVSYTG